MRAAGSILDWILSRNRRHSVFRYLDSFHIKQARQELSTVKEQQSLMSVREGCLVIFVIAEWLYLNLVPNMIMEWPCPSTVYVS